jgi:hypothetical protein
MADARVASIAQIDAALVTMGLNYDGSDGLEPTGTIKMHQLDEVFRMVKSQGGSYQLVSGILTILPAPSDTGE